MANCFHCRSITYNFCLACELPVCLICVDFHIATLKHNALIREKEETEMAMNFSVSKEDLLRSKVVKPGVYKFKVESVTQGPGTNDPQSTTTTINLTIVEGPDPTAVGVPIRYWISEKAAGLAVEFLEAVTHTKIPESGVNVDVEQAVGREVKGYVENEKYKGRMQNKIVGWLPA